MYGVHIIHCAGDDGSRIIRLGRDGISEVLCGIRLGGGLKTARTTIVAVFLSRPIPTHSSFCRNIPSPHLVSARETFYLIQLIFRPFLLADYIVIRLLYYNMDLWVSVCVYLLSSTKLLLPPNDLWHSYISTLPLWSFWQTFGETK